MYWQLFLYKLEEFGTMDSNLLHEEAQMRLKFKKKEKRKRKNTKKDAIYQIWPKSYKKHTHIFKSEEFWDS